MVSVLLPYDETNPLSIEEYAKNLIGETFREAVGNKQIKEKGNKGGLGQLLEKYYFLYEPNSNSEPDFKEAGVELKTTPYKINKSKLNKVAKERLVLNIINYMEVHKESFETSSFLHKNKLLLLVFYLHLEDIDRLDLFIKYVRLFSFPEKDMKIIKDDWNKIISKIKSGNAHELSEGDTNYLGACTKGKDKTSLRKQPFSAELAMQRAFSLKPHYMTYVLNEYILKGKKTYEDSVIKDLSDIKDITFEQFIINKINKYVGKSINELALKFNIKVKPNSKSFGALVANGLLGVKGDNIEEFKKANIKVKTIRIEKNGKVKEHMSFPSFKFIQIVNEKWEDSSYRRLFTNTRFLFFIYQFDEHNVLRLEKGMFWNIPLTDLEVDFKDVWEKTKDVIQNGIKIKKVGKREFNNLPGSSENRVAHVRPHAKNKSDTYPLPTGGQFPKQSFWLNNSYILEQISKNK
jgi:DNA mismatch repair protein MutH